jgi:hypothetical protein
LAPPLLQRLREQGKRLRPWVIGVSLSLDRRPSQPLCMCCLRSAEVVIA